jgi:hypothetical protein
MRMCKLLEELITFSAFFGLTGLAAFFTALYDHEGCEASSPTSNPT